jgi:hypothetical protein
MHMARVTPTRREEGGMAVPAVQSLTDFANPTPYTGGTPVPPSFSAKRTILINP